MLILPSRHVYVFDYEETEEKGFHFRNNKPRKHCVYATNKEVLEAQREHYINEGYKVSNIMECIY